MPTRRTLVARTAVASRRSRVVVLTAAIDATRSEQPREPSDCVPIPSFLGVRARPEGRGLREVHVAPEAAAAAAAAQRI